MFLFNGAGMKRVCSHFALKYAYNFLKSISRTMWQTSHNAFSITPLLQLRNKNLQPRNRAFYLSVTADLNLELLLFPQGIFNSSNWSNLMEYANGAFEFYLFLDFFISYLKSQPQISDFFVFGVTLCNCTKFQIVFPYRNWLKKLFKLLRQLATMKQTNCRWALSFYISL